MFSKIKLSGAQIKVFKLKDDVAVQIKGVAGSGKSTVALYRLAHMVKHAKAQGALFDEPVVRPIMFTFNRLLSDYLNKAFEHHLDDKELSETKIEFVTFHKWAYDFMKSRGKQLKKTQNSPSGVILNILNHDEKLADTQIADWEYIADEVQWIKGKAILSLEEYLNSDRRGRGRGLQKHHKEAVWTLCEAYEKKLADLNKIDFNDYALECMKELKTNPLNEDEQYTHIIVDEAQDLTKAQMCVITQLLGEGNNSITVIADAAQQIYNSGFIWADVGIRFAPQNVVDLTGNYRNTKEIGEFALQIENQLSDKSELSSFKLSPRDGDKPKLINVPTEKIISKAVELIKSTCSLDAGTICVMAKSTLEVREFTRAAYQAGLKPFNISESRQIPIEDFDVLITTMAGAKGLEFDRVIILNVVNGVIPYKIKDHDDDLDFYDKELKLLFTAITRAKQDLTIIKSKKNSLFLDGISEKYIQRINSDDEYCRCN